MAKHLSISTTFPPPKKKLGFTPPIFLISLHQWELDFLFMWSNDKPSFVFICTQIAEFFANSKSTPWLRQHCSTQCQLKSHINKTPLARYTALATKYP